MTTETLRRDWILFRRDWILHRRALLAAALIFAAFQVYFVIVANNPKLWLVFTCIYISFLTVIPLNREGKFRALAWSCTLPLTRANLARGRYVTAWTLASGLFLVAVVLAALVPGSKLSATMFLDPNYLLLAAAVTTFIIAQLLPFTIRFGLMGILIVLVVLQIFGALMFLTAEATGGVTIIEGGIGAAVRALADGAATLRETLSVPVFNLALLLALALVNWVSYNISVAIFRRREL
jgi:hypothetical protein